LGFGVWMNASMKSWEELPCFSRLPPTRAHCDAHFQPKSDVERRLQVPRMLAAPRLLPVFISRPLTSGARLEHSV
jgi:hypothetical protein